MSCLGSGDIHWRIIILSYLLAIVTTNLTSRQWLVFASFYDFLMELINIKPVYIRGWAGWAWGWGGCVAKA